MGRLPLREARSRALSKRDGNPDTDKGNSEISERVSTHQKVSGYKHEKDYRDHAVHGEEGGVQF
jgi:hypothetical protein